MLLFYPGADNKPNPQLFPLLKISKPRMEPRGWTVWSSRHVRIA
jgi:hypothetical protein